MTSSPLDPRLPDTVPGFDAPFFLAGLAGYSDAAMRIISRRHGCPYCVTESTAPETVLRGGRGLEKLRVRADDRPLAAQLIGGDPDPLAAAAAVLAGLGYSAIDVNLACPPKNKGGGRICRGGALLDDPAGARAVLAAVRAAVPGEIPTTVKLRRAYDDSPEMAQAFEEIFDASYELGYAWATVHCRTVVQKYDGPGRWPFLTELVSRYPDRVILGSGDVWTAADVFRLLEETGVHAAAVARGGIANPWIFRQAHQLWRGETPTEPTPTEIREVLEEHCQLSLAQNGVKQASRMMRKFGIKFSERYAPSEDLRRDFIAVRTLPEWHRVVDTHFPREETPSTAPSRS